MREPRLDAPKVTTLTRGTAVSISAQQGLWYQVQVAAGTTGFVRVNDVRVSYAGAEGGEANVRALFGGKSGEGRVTETAGVRGIDESELKAAALDQAQLNAMIGNRVDAAAGAAYAAEHGLAGDQRRVCGRGQGRKRGRANGGCGSQAQARQVRRRAPRFARARARLDAGRQGWHHGNHRRGHRRQGDPEIRRGSRGRGTRARARRSPAGSWAPARLWNDAEAQRRVNRIGRWVASQTSRPDLPWTFGVIDTPEVNAYAAPGGFVLVARGLYELLSSDSEVAAVLGHEISHCVQSDHYNVIRKQELASYGKELALKDVDADHRQRRRRLRPTLRRAIRRRPSC